MVYGVINGPIKPGGTNTYYCGDGPKYNEQSGGIDCRPCKSCRQPEEQRDSQQGCKEDQWCSPFRYCGKTDEYKTVEQNVVLICIVVPLLIIIIHLVHWTLQVSRVSQGVILP